MTYVTHLQIILLIMIHTFDSLILFSTSFTILTAVCYYDNGTLLEVQVMSQATGGVRCTTLNSCSTFMACLCQRGMNIEFQDCLVCSICWSPSRQDGFGYLPLLLSAVLLLVMNQASSLIVTFFHVHRTIMISHVNHECIKMPLNAELSIHLIAIIFCASKKGRRSWFLCS